MSWSMCEVHIQAEFVVFDRSKVCEEVDMVLKEDMRHVGAGRG